MGEEKKKKKKQITEQFRLWYILRFNREKNSDHSYCEIIVYKFDSFESDMFNKSNLPSQNFIICT